MESNSPQTLFHPLSSARATRIFTLGPGIYTDPVVGSLEEYELDDLSEPGSADYEALSYCWGPPTINQADVTNVAIDGQLIEIRKNLYQALLRLRLPDQSRRLWIDLLCISQSDPEEKAEQVKQIGRIFSYAKRVVIWTGEHYHNSELLFLGKSVVCQDLDAQAARLGVQWDWYKTYHGSIFQDWLETWASSYLAFFQRPYWKRFWPIQEIGVAAEAVIQCGHSQKPWEAIVNVLWEDELEDPSLLQELWTKGLVLQELEQVEYPDHIVNLALRRTPVNDSIEAFFDLLMQCSDAECEDRRDRIYSLVSLFGGLGLGTAHLIPDYTITVPELFVRVCEAFLSEEFLSTGPRVGRATLPYHLDHLASGIRLERSEVELVLKLLLGKVSSLGKGATWAHLIYIFFWHLIRGYIDHAVTQESTDSRYRFSEVEAAAMLNLVRCDPAMREFVDLFPDELSRGGTIWPVPSQKEAFMNAVTLNPD